MRLTAAVGRLLLLFTASPLVVGDVGPNTYGQTSASLSWVGVGCRVHILNTSNVVAMSANLSATCQNVKSIGLSSDGLSALVGVQPSGDVTLLQLIRNDDTEGYILETSAVLELPSDLSPNRIADAVSVAESGYNTSYAGNIFFVAANSNDGGSGAIVVLSLDSSPTLTVVTSLDLGVPGLNDVQVLSSSQDVVVIFALTSLGLQQLEFHVSTGVLSATDFVIDAPGSNDALALSTSGLALLAQGGNGLSVVNISAGVVVGMGEVEGWAGGVRFSGGGDNNSPLLALVASDPGLFAYNLASPESPSEVWACRMEEGGTGWNLCVVGCFAFVADYSQGLQVVQFCDDKLNVATSPEIVAHYGNGSLLVCS